MVAVANANDGVNAAAILSWSVKQTSSSNVYAVVVYNTASISSTGTINVHGMTDIVDSGDLEYVPAGTSVYPDDSSCAALLGASKNSGPYILVGGGVSNLVTEPDHRYAAKILSPYLTVARTIESSYNTGGYPPSDWNSFMDYASQGYAFVYPLVGRSTAYALIVGYSNGVSGDYVIYNIGTGEIVGSADYLNPATAPYIINTLDEQDDSLIAYNPYVGETQAHTIGGTYVRTYDLLTGSWGRRSGQLINKYVILTDTDSFSPYSRHVLYILSGGFQEFPGGGASIYAFAADTLQADFSSEITVLGELTTASGIYNPVFSYSGYAMTEVSQSAPSLFFGGVPASGVFTAAYVMKSGELLRPPLARSLAGDSIPVMPKVRDARSASLLGPVYSKSLTEVGYEHEVKDFAFVLSGGMWFRDMDSRPEIPWNPYVTDSEMWRMETTNAIVDTEPYYFYSTSGNPSEFFQKDPGVANFVEYSTGLPGSNITVIRVDDRI